jgi:hypothetical protein
MLHPLVKFFHHLIFLISFLFIGTYPLLISCRRNLGEPNCGEFFPSACFKSILTNDPTILSSTRSFNLTKDASDLSPARSLNLTKDSSSFSSARSSALPRMHPASPQPEASTLPRTPQASPQLDIQEPLIEPEKLPSPTLEARNDVSMNIHLSIFYSVNHH